MRGLLGGITIRGDIGFDELFRPLLPSLFELYWHLDLPFGPFQITDRSDYETLEEELEGLSVERRGARRGSLWRPGTFPRFARYLVEDEWGYFTAIAGGEARAVEVAERLDREEVLSPRFLAVVEQGAELFAVRRPSSWKVYCGHEDWIRALSETHPVEPVDPASIGYPRG